MIRESDRRLDVYSTRSVHYVNFVKKTLEIIQLYVITHVCFMMTSRIEPIFVVPGDRSLENAL